MVVGVETANEFVESLKSFSEAIAQELKTYNIPAEALKPIEESVKELGKEVGDMKDRKDLTSIERQNLRTKVAALVEKIIRTLPTKSVDVDLFTSLEPLSKLIGKDVREIVLNTQKQTHYLRSTKIKQNAHVELRYLTEITEQNISSCKN